MKTELAYYIYESFIFVFRCVYVVEIVALLWCIVLAASRLPANDKYFSTSSGFMPGSGLAQRRRPPNLHTAVSTPTTSEQWLSDL